MAKYSTTSGQQIITDAAQHIRETQVSMLDEQNERLEAIARLTTDDNYADFTFDRVPELVVRTLATELGAVQALNTAIAQNKSAGCDPHYGIRTHKLVEIIEGTTALATDTNIAKILQGTLPTGYNNSIGTSLPILGNQEGFWETSKPTFTTTILEVMYCTITGEEIRDSATSATLHTFFLPEKFDWTPVTPSLFIDIDGESPELTVPHSGYSFGGDRLDDKEFKPQDCTSFLEMTAQLPANGASTVDLYLTKRVLSKQGLVIIDEKWLPTAGGQMVKLFDVNTKTPQPGDMLACRKFNESKPIDYSFGYGGHAGIYLGRDAETVVTLAYNRDMPHMEGFGIENRPYTANYSELDQFYLTRKDLDFTFSGEVFPFENLGDLAALTAFVDSQISDEPTKLNWRFR